MYVCVEWEKLAKGMKGNVKIAYWDTEQSGRPPALLGQIQGTPTIRYFIPTKKNFTKKKTMEYQYERKAKDMKVFVEQNMPNYLESIKNSSSGLTKFQEKATKYNLPQALLFTSKASTLAMSKFFSVEFRRKLLIGEIHPTKPNKELLDKFQITSTPALIIITQDGEEIRYDGTKEDFTKNKLYKFLSKHALKEPVPIKKKEETPKPEEEEAPKVKTEL